MSVPEVYSHEIVCVEDSVATIAYCLLPDWPIYDMMLLIQDILSTAWFITLSAWWFQCCVIFYNVIGDFGI